MTRTNGIPAGRWPARAEAADDRPVRGKHRLREQTPPQHYAPVVLARNSAVAVGRRRAVTA